MIDQIVLEYVRTDGLTPPEEMTQSDYTMIFHEDVLDMAKLCVAALAQDSPNDPYHYINQLLNYLRVPFPNST